MICHTPNSFFQGVPVASRTITRALLASTLSLIITGIAHAAAIERLSLFVYDGTNAYEDRRIVSPQSNLPAGMTAQFTADTDAQDQHTWAWVLQNTGSTAYHNLRVTLLLDADISPEDNTFHNEHGKLLQLSAPTGHIAADKWEIGEIGYLTGDLLLRAAQGTLANQSGQAAANADDTALALSFDIGTIQSGDTLTVTATFAETGTSGLLHEDAHDDNQHVFQAYAKLTPKAAQAVDYAVTKTTTTPNLNIGDTANYTMTVTNNGPDNGTGVTLTDTVPSQIADVTWTCAGNGAATCGTANGSGNAINITGQVPTGASNNLTITVTGTAITSDTVTNTATIARQQRRQQHQQCEHHRSGDRNIRRSLRC